MENIRSLWNSEYEIEVELEEEFDNDEDKIQNYIDDELQLRLDDLRSDFDVPTNKLIMFGTLGLWNGRVSGYKYINGNNLKNIFYDEGDSVHWYFNNETKELECRSSHHDGVNYYTYRELKSELTCEEEIDFENLLYNGVYTKEDLDKYSDSLESYLKEKNYV